MAQIKNTQYSQLDDVSKKQKLKIKEYPADDTADQGCVEKIQRKFESCTDVLANYFQCVRVFSNEKLEQLRRKALQQQRQLDNKSEVSLQHSEKFSQLQKNPEFKNYSKKQKDILLEDFDELPAQHYQTNKVLRFTKRYAETYDQSYSQRRKRFGYTFEEVEIEREKQYHKKDKNFWSQFKRLICCRGGNYIEELEQREKETDGESISQIKSQKKSAVSRKDKNQNNIFLFEEDGPVDNPQQIPQNYQQKNSSKTNKLNKQENEYLNSSRKTQNQESINQKENEARKISSRLGVDTKLVIKRKQYEYKTNDQYNQDINTQSRNDVQINSTEKNKTNESNNINTATNSERTGSYGQPNQNNNQLNRFDIEDNFFNEGDQPNQQDGQDGGDIDWNRNRRFQDGVAKVKVDKKAKMSKMIKQVEHQNDQQFNPNQVIFFSEDVKNNNQGNDNFDSNNNYGTVNNTNNYNNNYNNNYEHNYNQNNNNNFGNNNQNNQYNNNDNSDYNNGNNYNNYNNGNNDANDTWGGQSDNSGFINGDQQDDTMNMSNISQVNNSNYQRVKKAKTKNKNMDMIKKSFENYDDEDKIQYVDESETNMNQHHTQSTLHQQNSNQFERSKKNNSVRLIVKDAEDKEELNLEDIPSINNSTVQLGELDAFKKKRKTKAKFANNQADEEKEDGIILMDQSNNYSSNNNNNYDNDYDHNSYENNNRTSMSNEEYGTHDNSDSRQTVEMKSNVAPPQQMKKKKKNKRNNLIVEEGEVYQEVIEVENF